MQPPAGGYDLKFLDDALAAPEAACSIAVLDNELLAADTLLQRETAALDAVLKEAVSVAWRHAGVSGRPPPALEPFHQVGGLLATAMEPVVPQLFVDDPASPGPGAGELATGWLRHVTATALEASAPTQGLAADLLQRMHALGPQECKRRDAMLPLLAPVMPPSELWRQCVAWRARHLPVPTKAELTAHVPAVIAAAFERFAVASASALRQDLALLRSFAASSLRLSGEAMADELLGVALVETYVATMEKLHAASTSAPSAANLSTAPLVTPRVGGRGGSDSAVAAALRCYSALNAFARYTATMLAAAGLADGTDADEACETPSSLVPSAVQTPSAIVFTEVGGRSVQDSAGSSRATLRVAVAAGEHIAPHLSWLERAARSEMEAHAGDDDTQTSSASPPDAAEAVEPRLNQGCTRRLRLVRAVAAIHSSAAEAVSVEQADVSRLMGVRVAFIDASGEWVQRHLSAAADRLAAGDGVPSTPRRTAATVASRQRECHELAWRGELGQLLQSIASATPEARPRGTLAMAAGKLQESVHVDARAMAERHGRLLRTFVLPGVDQGHHWLAHRPFLPRRSDDLQIRCSHAVLMWRFQLHAVVHDLVRSGGDWPSGSGAANTTAAAAAVLAPLLVDSLSSLATRYTRLVFSRARAFQYQTDVFAIVAIARSFSQSQLLRRLQGFVGAEAEQGEQSAAVEGSVTKIEGLCAVLLRCMAVMTAPLPQLLKWLDAWLNSCAAAGATGLTLPPTTAGGVFPSWFDPTEEEVLPPTAATKSQAIVGAKGAGNDAVAAGEKGFDPIRKMGQFGSTQGGSWDLSTQPWFERGENTIDWGLLLRLECADAIATPMTATGIKNRPSASLDAEAAIDLLRRRTELRAGDYPPLTDVEQAGTERLQDALAELSRRAGQEVVTQEQEERKFVKAFSSDDDY